LVIGSTAPVGRRTPGTIGAYPDGVNDITGIYPLSVAEKEHLQTRAAIPYRDPSLSDTGELILSRRRQEQETSSLETSSKWRKRWLGKG
jgi:tRNA U34 5-methylaminomethyl-2-thiouridine-forming methyltransferase MnmC